jgi:uncharacterized protein
MFPVIVADAGPLIALAKLQLLALMPQIFARLVIPQTVLAEATVEGQMGAEAVKLFVSQHDSFMEVVPTVQSDLIDALSVTLGRGEVQAIHYASERGCAVFLDERCARKLALVHGVQVLGIGGFLLRCKQLKLMVAVVPALRELQTHGYFLADTLIAQLAAAANEPL